MFDNITWEYPLPDEEHNKLAFQSKDFDCLLDNYRVSKEGRLLFETYRTEDHSDHNATGIDRLLGCMTRIPTGWEDVNFHGWFGFYTSICKTGEDLHTNKCDHDWIEYEAKFTDGQVVEIIRVQ